MTEEGVVIFLVDQDVSPNDLGVIVVVASVNGIAVVDAVVVKVGFKLVNSEECVVVQSVTVSDQVCSN